MVACHAYHQIYQSANDLLNVHLVTIARPSYPGVHNVHTTRLTNGNLTKAEFLKSGLHVKYIHMYKPQFERSNAGCKH